MAGVNHASALETRGASEPAPGTRDAGADLEELRHLSPDARIRRLREIQDAEERKRRELEEERKHAEREIAHAHELIRESEEELEHLEQLEEERAHPRRDRAANARHAESAEERADDLEEIVAAQRVQIDELSRPYRTGAEIGYDATRPGDLGYVLGGRREPGPAGQLYERRGGAPQGEDERLYVTRTEQLDAAGPGMYRNAEIPGRDRDSNLSTNILHNLYNR